MQYRSTEQYTAEEFTDMGATRVRVKNSQNMVTDILTPEQFVLQFEEIPPEVTPHE